MTPVLAGRASHSARWVGRAGLRIRPARCCHRPARLRPGLPGIPLPPRRHRHRWARSRHPTHSRGDRRTRPSSSGRRLMGRRRALLAERSAARSGRRGGWCGERGCPLSQRPRPMRRTDRGALVSRAPRRRRLL